MPPAQVGQASDTAPANGAQAESQRQAHSATISINKRLVVPAVKLNPRCARRQKRTCAAALILARRGKYFFRPSPSFGQVLRSASLAFSQSCVQPSLADQAISPAIPDGYRPQKRSAFVAGLCRPRGSRRPPRGASIPLASKICLTGVLLPPAEFRHSRCQFMVASSDANGSFERDPEHGCSELDPGR
jgi:hypothetical protein